MVSYLLFKISNITNSLKEMESPAYGHDLDERVKAFNGHNANVTIVRNDEVGIWDKEGKAKIKLVLELSIGGEQEKNRHKIFYRASPIMADSQGNIYVAEAWSDKTIKKFDANGNYLLTMGRKGQGPGEFSGFFTFVFSENRFIYVLDQGAPRINKISLDGNFLGSFPLQKKYIPIEFSGFQMDSLHNFYLSFFDLETDKVIHKFSPSGLYITSFGKPLDVKNPDSYISRSLKTSNSHGSIVLFNDRIFYSQYNPYEIRIYKLDGTLERVVFRKNSFMPPHKVEILAEGSYGFTVPAHSSLIGIWRNMIINCVFVPLYISEEIGTVIDFFNLDGQLLTSIQLEEQIYFTYIDQEGKLYGNAISPYDEEERIVRYSLNFEAI